MNSIQLIKNNPQFGNLKEEDEDEVNSRDCSFESLLFVEVDVKERMAADPAVIFVGVV